MIILQKLFQITLEAAGKYGNMNLDSVRGILETECLVKRSIYYLNEEINLDKVYICF